MANITLSEDQILGIMPRAPQIAAWLPPINEAIERFSITSPPRAAAFLAQVAHESGELTRLVESLNYSASRLMQVWPKRFPTVDKAAEYERNDQKLANYVY